MNRKVQSYQKILGKYSQLYYSVTGETIDCVHQMLLRAGNIDIVTGVSKASPLGLLSLLPTALLGLVMSPCREGEGSLYDHEMTLLDGSRNVSLSEYGGKVVLLVNVATY